MSLPDAASLSLTYPDSAHAFLARFREQQPHARLQSDYEAWTILRLSLDDLALIVRSLRGRPMVDGRPFRDSVIRIGAECLRAVQDLGHTPEFWGSICYQAYRQIRGRYESVYLANLARSPLHLYALLESNFAALHGAIGRSVIDASRAPRDPVNLRSTNSDHDYRPLDVYLSLYLNGWIGLEELNLCGRFQPTP